MTYAEKIAAEDRILDPTAARVGSGAPRAGADAPRRRRGARPATASGSGCWRRPRGRRSHGDPGPGELSYAGDEVLLGCADADDAATRHRPAARTPRDGCRRVPARPRQLMATVDRPAADVSPSRACAYRVVRRVFEQGAYADRALHAEAVGLDSRERSFAMALTYTAVQRRATLDHVIERLAGRPVRAAGAAGARDAAARPDAAAAARRRRRARRGRRVRQARQARRAAGRRAGQRGDAPGDPGRGRDPRGARRRHA